MDRWLTDDFDYYQELGVGADATSEQIRAARRAGADRHHPDKNAAADADTRAQAADAMARINVAHEVLIDPDHRARYDRWRHRTSLSCTRRSTAPIVVLEPSSVDLGALPGDGESVRRVLIRNRGGAYTLADFHPKAGDWWRAWHEAPDDGDGSSLGWLVIAARPHGATGGREACIAVMLDGSTASVTVRAVVSRIERAGWWRRPSAATFLALFVIAVMLTVLVASILAPAPRSVRSSARNARESNVPPPPTAATLPTGTPPPPEPEPMTAGVTPDAPASLQPVQRVVGESRYDDPRYVARVGDVIVSGSTVIISFESSGVGDLRRPENSCLVVNGTPVMPTFVDLEIDERERFAGSMTFRVSRVGTYSFVYSCASDYSAVPLFTR